MLLLGLLVVLFVLVPAVVFVAASGGRVTAHALGVFAASTGVVGVLAVAADWTVLGGVCLLAGVASGGYALGVRTANPR